ncbi:DedA family protein [Candidatus Woesearchaeota archaeon]|nr:DedA family protein [Candidatus Woesearchaeota archaeon]
MAMNPLDLIFHLDKYLDLLITTFGGWTYAILFLIIFAETGFVAAPFLPGDSLLFAAGAFATRGVLNFWLLAFLMVAAAILGDTVNYWIGYSLGPKIFKKERGFFFRREHLHRTQAFFQKYGAKTIVIGRFLPIIRTFAPFVAGIGRMSYGKFLAYNIVGGIIWAGGFTALGYLFGNIPFIKDNFTYVLIIIILLSLLPVVWELVSHHWHKKQLAYPPVQ